MAFDTIDHKILLEKLAAYGIRGVAHDWIYSYRYLSCRKQYVQTTSPEADLKIISCRVQQGSVLGSLLFLLYINDLVNVSDLANAIIFADDTNLFFENDNLADLETVTNLELNKISNWFKIITSSFVRSFFAGRSPAYSGPQR